MENRGGWTKTRSPLKQPLGKLVDLAKLAGRRGSEHFTFTKNIFHAVKRHASLFPMNWFTKSAELTETITAASHLRWDERRLVEIQGMYEQAEREFDIAHQRLFQYTKQNPDSRSVLLNRHLFCRVGAMTADPVRTKLETARASALTRRNALLQERAELLKDLKLVR